MRRENIFSILQKHAISFTHSPAVRLFFDYQKDPLLRSGVERQFEIVGEALNQAIQNNPSLAKLISNSSRIISFRNRPIHGYATIADEVVWGVPETNLPVLTCEVEDLLEKAGDSS